MSEAGPFSKRLEGRDEAIVDPDIAIIDTHTHLMAMPGLHYMFDELLEDVYAGHNIVATVYVETGAMSRTSGPELLRPIGEIEFANGIAAMSDSGQFGACRVNAAIVGHAKISAGDAVAEMLDRALATASDRLVGFREMAFYHPTMPMFPEGMLVSDSFRDGFRQLAARSLFFEAGIFHNQLPDLCDLADRFPNARLAVNHMGMAFANGMDEKGQAEAFVDWRSKLAELAKRPNVLCKVGGLGFPTWGFGYEARPDAVGSAEMAERWRPFVETAVELFGTSRCVTECDFPMDGQSGGYVPQWNALKLITRQYSATERAALHHDNAAAYYGIKPL